MNKSEPAGRRSTSDVCQELENKTALQKLKGILALLLFLSRDFKNKKKRKEKQLQMFVRSSIHQSHQIEETHFQPLSRTHPRSDFVLISEIDR